MVRRSLLIACGAIAAANVALQVAGCNDIGNAPPVVDKEAGGPPDTGPALCAGELPVVQVMGPDGKLGPGDWSCYSDTFDGSTIAPFDDGGLDVLDLDVLGDVVPPLDGGTDGETGGAADGGDAGDSGTTTDAGATCTFHLTDFISNQPVPDAPVDLFFTNAFGTPDFAGVTNATGSFTFPAPSTDVMAYLVKPYADAGANHQLEPVAQFDNAACKAGQMFPGNSITASGVQLLATGILGSSKVDPQKMAVVIGVRDCQNREALGGVVQVVDDQTGQVLSNDATTPDFRGAYFNPTGFPDGICTHTVAVAGQQYALYAALNVPTDRPVSAKVFVRRDSDPASQPRLLGTRKIPALPGGVVIVRPYKLTKQ